MIFILTTFETAPAIAESLGDTVNPGSRMWISPSIDVRAVKAAAALAGDDKAVAINIDSFAVGVFATFTSGILSIVGFHLTQPLGRAIASWTSVPEHVTPAAVPASEESKQ